MDVKITEHGLGKEPVTDVFKMTMDPLEIWKQRGYS
jgi:hypothetical protein